MNWRTLDLNLLVVFDAVAQTRSATKAGERLNMAQPAISHALGRLRGALRDDLFIRTPDGMAPTPFAEGLSGAVREALERLGTALDSAAPFDPATAQRSFLLAADNRATLVLAAPLASAIAAEASGVNLSIVPSGTLPFADMLDRGELDLVLGAHAAPGERFSDQLLFENGFVALTRRGHPAARDGRIALEDMGAYPHLVLSSTHETTDFVDDRLAREGLRRRVAFSGPLLAAPAVLARSDMIAVMAERGAREFARVAPLEVLTLPFETPQVFTCMLWHRRYDDVPAHRWLRGVVRRIARTV
jgi:DNA-binding transcriptional LysR family regulator